MHIFIYAQIYKNTYIHLCKSIIDFEHISRTKASQLIPYQKYDQHTNMGWTFGGNIYAVYKGHAGQTGHDNTLYLQIFSIF
jgi:hypothetical protein